MMCDFDDIHIWGCNIPNEIKSVTDRIEEDIKTSFEDEKQRQIYPLGVDNTLSILKQFLDISTRKNNVILHYPDTETTTELTVEDLVKWAENLPEWTGVKQ